MEITDNPGAEAWLSSTIERVRSGVAVVITREGQPVARLVAYIPDPAPRVGGQWAGRVWMADDFDALPPDIAEAFGMEPE